MEPPARTPDDARRPALSAVVAIGQYLCGDKPTGSDIRLFTTVQSYEYGGRQHYPGGERRRSPSGRRWPLVPGPGEPLGWVGPEERSAWLLRPLGQV